MAGAKQAPAQKCEAASEEPRASQPDRGLLDSPLGIWAHIVAKASSLALQYQQDQTGTEHVLLALISYEQSRVGPILRTFGMTSDYVKDFIAGLPITPMEPDKTVRFSPELVMAVGLAIEEAIRRGSHYLRTEHLLLGLIHQNNSRAIDILLNLHISLPGLQK